MNEKQREILENNFYVYEQDNYIELEAWTDGGVDMIIDIHSDKELIEELEDYVNFFDIDEEIELHREGKDYRDAFTIRESLNDFENWLKWVKDIIEQLKAVK